MAHVVTCHSQRRIEVQARAELWGWRKSSPLFLFFHIFSHSSFLPHFLQTRHLLLLFFAEEMSRKALCVAEKPSMANEISRVLSNGRTIRRPGLSQYNANLEFKCAYGGINYDITMTSVLGHLTEMEFPLTYKSWQSCNPAVLFQAPVGKVTPQVPFLSLSPHTEHGCLKKMVFPHVFFIARRK